jgi:hypothetical protein
VILPPAPHPLVAPFAGSSSSFEEFADPRSCSDAREHVRTPERSSLFTVGVVQTPDGATTCYHRPAGEGASGRERGLLLEREVPAKKRKLGSRREQA